MKHELDYFFHPDGVAILGASGIVGSDGFYILRNVCAGYTGKVYPVNPKYQELLGIPCYPDIESIPDKVECLIYFIPARFILDIIRRSAAKGISSGFLGSQTSTSSRPVSGSTVDFAGAYASGSRVRRVVGPAS